MSYGAEMDAAKAYIDGFKEAVAEVERLALTITRCSTLKVVRCHWLDQDSKLTKTSARQSGFKYHTDKDKEFAKDPTAHSLSDGRDISIIFTVVMRIGGVHSSAMQVLGFKRAQMDEAGDAHLFLSRLQHCTFTLGGHKIAFFLGWPAPLIAEERLTRFQDMFSV
jgi:hypothetical protein